MSLDTDSTAESRSNNASGRPYEQGEDMNTRLSITELFEVDSPVMRRRVQRHLHVVCWSLRRDAETEVLGESLPIRVQG